MAAGKLKNSEKKLLEQNPELLGAYEAECAGGDNTDPNPPVFIPCCGTQSFTQGMHTYQIEYVSTPSGGLKYTGRVL